MSQICIKEKKELDERIQQALQLNIQIKDNMKIEHIEKEIVKKLEIGMQDLKILVDEITHIES